MNEQSTFRGRAPWILAGLILGGVCIGALAWQGSSPAQDKLQSSSSAVSQHAREMSLAFRHAAETVLPTVVTIETKTKARRIRRRGMPEGNPFEGTPFEEFFGPGSPFGDSPFGDEEFHGQPSPRQQGMGSGVIIEESGLVLTNNHVVEGADEVTIRLSDGREFKGLDIKTDPQTDIALVRIDAQEKFPTAKLGDSDQLEIGDWVIAVGNPFGLESTVSAGIISGKGRGLMEKRTSFLQTDAAINPGNSGGPLVNMEGEVIGINTAIATSSGGYQGVGFAIPVNKAKWVYAQLLESGTVQRAYMGVIIGNLTPDLAKQMNLSSTDGALVQELSPSSPAAEAGIKIGDVITQFNGKKVRGSQELQELVERSPLGKKMDVTVMREGKAVNLSLVLKSFPQELLQGKGEADGKSEENGFMSEDIGMEVVELTPELATQLDMKGQQGVLISQVSPDGPAAEVGLREGMLILKVGSTEVHSVEEFKEAIKDKKISEGILLLVRTSQGNRFVVLKN